jgi:hypothetical protein
MRQREISTAEKKLLISTAKTKQRADRSCDEPLPVSQRLGKMYQAA